MSLITCDARNIKIDEKISISVTAGLIESEASSSCCAHFSVCSDDFQKSAARVKIIFTWW